MGYHLWGYIGESSLHHFHSEWHLCTKRDHNSIWPPSGINKWRWNRVAHLTNTQIQQDKQEKGNVMIARRVHRLGKLSNAILVLLWVLVVGCQNKAHLIYSIYIYAFHSIRSCVTSQQKRKVPSSRRLPGLLCCSSILVKIRRQFKLHLTAHLSLQYGVEVH